MKLFRNKLLFSLTAILMFVWLLNPAAVLAVTTIGANISTDGYLKIGTAVPGVPVDGMIYYDTGANKFMCYENGSWVDCIGGISIPLDVASGGTGITTYTIGDMLYATGANTLTKLPIGTDNALLTVSGGLPTWATAIPLVITNTYVVADQATRLALAAGIGDVAVQTDNSTTYILQSLPPTNPANWVVITPPSTVLSVNGHTSVVTLTPGDLGIGPASTPTFTGLNLTGLTTGSVPFVGAGGAISQDNTKLFWNNGTKRLGIGTNTPAYALEVTGDIKAGNGSRLLLGQATTGLAPAGVNGAMYYNTSTDKFKCFENSTWKDCISVSSGAQDFESIYATDADKTLTTSDNAFTVNTGTNDFIVTSNDWGVDASGNLTATGTLQSGINGQDGQLKIYAEQGGTDYAVTFNPNAAMTQDTIYTLPADDGTASQFLQTDGGGNLTWANAAGGGSSALSSITAAAGANSINNGDNAQTWNWNLTNNNKSGLTLGENTASTGTGTSILSVSNLATSTAVPLVVNNISNATASFRVNDTAGDTSPFIISDDGDVGIGTTDFGYSLGEPTKLAVEADPGQNTSMRGEGDLNDHLHISLRNRNSGGLALSGFLAEADNYVGHLYTLGVGITSSAYSDPAFTLAGANDGFVVSHGNNLIVGTSEATAPIKFATGGTLAANERMRIDSSGNVGVGTTSINAKLDLKPATADALRVEPYGAVAGNTGNLEMMELVANGSNYVGFKAPDNIASNLVWTLPSADGTSGQVLSTDGSGVLSWISGATSEWQRVGTTLSPATAGDAVTSDGLLTGNTGLAITGATDINTSTATGGDVKINVDSNYDTYINTGTSTGTVTIGNSLSGAVVIQSASTVSLLGGANTLTTPATEMKFQPAGSGTTGYVKIGEGQTGSATPDLLALDVTSVGFGVGDPVGAFDDGSMYYNEAANEFRCRINGSWSGCDTTGGTATLQSVYNAAGGNTITTGAGNDIAFTLTAGDFTATGTGSVDLTPTGASSFTSGAGLTLTGGATSTWSVTGAGNDLNIAAADVMTLATTTGDIALQPAGGVSANVQVGTTGTSATPNYLVLDNGTAEPAGSNGAMYYSTALNAFRCYVNGGWQDCGATAASATTLQQAYVAGNTITTSAAEGDFNVAGTEAVNLTPTAASQFTSGAGLTLTGGATSIWSVTGAGNDLTIDAADVLSLGTTNATAVNIGKAGVTTTNIGPLVVSGGTLQTGNAATAGNLLVYDGSTNKITITSPAIASDYTLTLPTTAGSVGQALTTTNGTGTLAWASLMTNPMSALGDIIYGGIGGAATSLPGSAGFLKSTGAAAPTWSAVTASDVGLSNVTNDAQIPKAIGTAKGDIIAYTASNTPVRLPVGGTNGLVLQVDSSQATGMRWAANTVTADSLDFTDFSDAMTVDANTSINLAGNSLTINDLTGSGALSMSTNAAALTLTSNGTATWSVTGAGNDLTIDSADVLNLGTTNATALSVGRAAATFAIASTGLNVTTGGDLSGVASLDTISTSATALTFAGAGTVSPGGANILTLGSTNTTSTTNIQSGTGNINLLPATAGTTANVQIGAGGAGSTTPDLLVLDVKSNAGDLGAQPDGAMYYNAVDNQFRCRVNGSWVPCDTTGASSLQGAYDGGNSITTSGLPIHFDLASGDFNVDGTDAATITPGGALTLTGGATSTWSVTGAGNDLTVDAADVLNLGTTNATAVNIGKTGITTTNPGAFISSQTLTASDGLTLTTGALNLTATSGALTMSGMGTSSLNFGVNNLTLTSGNISATATGINSTAIGATTPSTGKFTSLTSTGATDLANAGASNVTIATTGTGTVNIGNSTGSFTLTSTGLNVTSGVVSLKPYGVAAGNTTEQRFLELAANGGNYSGFKAADLLGTNTIYVLPATDPTAGQVLASTAPVAGVATLSWSTPSTTTAFSGITSATNTTAAMVVGTGASLAATGTGTITATAVPFSGVSGATNANALVIGTGGSLTSSGTGTITTNQFVGSGSTTNAVDLATAEVAGTLAIANGGTNGTASPTNGGVAYGTGTAYAFSAVGTSGQFLKSNGAAAPTWADVFTPKIAQYYDSAGATSITTGSIAIPFNNEPIEDSYYSHDNVTNNSRITFNTTGVYKISYNISSHDTTDSRENVQCRGRIDGTTDITPSKSYSYGRNTTDKDQTNTATFIYSATATHYLEIVCTLTGSNYTASTNAGESWMTLEFIR